MAGNEDAITDGLVAVAAVAASRPFRVVMPDRSRGGAVNESLKEYLERAIDDFQATQRTDAQGDLLDQDIAETLRDLADSFDR